jgi:hypothetical protein
MKKKKKEKIELLSKVQDGNELLIILKALK